MSRRAFCDYCDRPAERTFGIVRLPLGATSISPLMQRSSSPSGMFVDLCETHAQVLSDALRNREQERARDDDIGVENVR